MQPCRRFDALLLPKGSFIGSCGHITSLLCPVFSAIKPSCCAMFFYPINSLVPTFLILPFRFFWADLYSSIFPISVSAASPAENKDWLDIKSNRTNLFSFVLISCLIWYPLEQTDSQGFLLSLHWALLPNCDFFEAYFVDFWIGLNGCKCRFRCGPRLCTLFMCLLYFSSFTESFFAFFFFDIYDKRWQCRT